MTATLTYLERLKEAYGGVTDYRAAKLLNIKQTTISSWKRRGSQAEDEIILRFAELLDLPEDLVMAEIHADSARTELAREYWNAKYTELQKAV